VKAVGQRLDDTISQGMRSMRRTLTALAIAWTVTGCGVFTESPAGSSTSTGEYTLQSVNNSPLPFTISQTATTKTELVDDVIQLFQGGTFARTYHTRTTANGQATSTANTRTGTWAIGLGATITLTANEDRSTMIVSINARRMTSVQEGNNYVYLK
jgi:ABC-type oligopeptide transport system substrate-binding subunit